MTNKLIARAEREMLKLETQRDAVRAAVAAAFPVGSRVISKARSKQGTTCVVTGHCGAYYSPEIGYLYLHNIHTGKNHKALAVGRYKDVELVERAKA